MLENEGVKHTLEKYYNLGATLEWFFKILRTFMMFIGLKSITDFLEDHEKHHQGILEIDEFQRRQERAYIRLCKAEMGVIPQAKSDDRQLVQQIVGLTKCEEKEHAVHCSKFKEKFVEYLTDRFMLALTTINYEFHVNMIKYLSAPSKMLLNLLSALHAQSSGVRYQTLRHKIVHDKSQKNLGRGSSNNYTFKLLKDCLIKLEKMGMVHISRKPIGMESNIVLLISDAAIIKMQVFDEKRALEETNGAMDLENGSNESVDEITLEK